MENDPVFAYLKLVLENVTLWQILALGLVVTLFRRPQILTSLPQHISKLRVGEVEFELRELREELAETRSHVAVIENDLEREEQARFDDLLERFDAHAPVAELETARASLKAAAPSMEDLTPVVEGLESRDAKALYAAAEIARARRDTKLFDPLVARLDALAREPDLGGIRLHTVWTMTSAVHRTLIADIRDRREPTLTAAQFSRARAMLDRLVVNPRVLADRPDNPMKGVRGPAKWAGDWIAKGLAAQG